MSTFNKLPYSNQFERGHSFNWAGHWKPNTHYFNDEYVTDFVVFNSCLLACRQNHLSSDEPVLVFVEGRVQDVEGMDWEFVADLTKENPAEISGMSYDEQSGTLTITYFGGKSDTFNINVKLSDSTIHTGPTPPENTNKIWIDTNDTLTNQVHDEPDVIESIQRAVYTLQKQMAKLILIRTNGVVSGKLTDATLTEIGNKWEPEIPEAIEEDYNAAIEDEDIDPEEEQKKEEEFPAYAEEMEPTVNHISIKMGTYYEIQNSLRYFINGELVWCTDRRCMYIFDNGRLYTVASSGSDNTDDDGMTQEELQNYLNNLSSINFVPINKPDSKYTVKVNEYGNIIVYDSNNDSVLPEPTSRGIYFPGTLASGQPLGAIVINSIYLGGLDKDEHSYQACSHNFVELANISYNDINLNGMCLMYTSTGETWIKLPLWGIIKAQSTFLIRGAQCSVMDVNTTKLKVKSFDMEWRNEGELVKFDRGSQKGAFYLCWCDVANNNQIYVMAGDSNIKVDSPIGATSIFAGSDENTTVAFGYQDLFGFGAIDYKEKTAYPMPSGQQINENTLFVRTYSLDPVKQSNPQGLSKRNNKKYWYHVNLDEVINSGVERYTPKASYENKTLATDKHKFVEDKPNTLTCSFGIQATDNTAQGGSGATRCFNWNSVGYYDEYLWYKKSTVSTWTRVESYKEGVNYVTLNRSTDPACIKTPNTDFVKYYTRKRWETFYGAPITTHKVMITGLDAATYEYKVGRSDSEGNPTDYVSKTRTFIVRSNSQVTSFDFIQTTDQQAGNWEEYQVWSLSADYINRNERIGQTPVVSSGDDTPTANAKDFDFTINTGDITYNGSRPNEWIDYYDGYSHIDDKEEMLTLGNNDLSPIPLNFSDYSDPSLAGMRMLGVGGEMTPPDKIGHVVSDLFYTFELDIDNPPVFEGTIYGGTNTKQYRIPSLYSFNYGAFHFVSLNSEIRTINDGGENSVSTVEGEFGVQDIETSTKKSQVYDNVEDWMVRDLLKWKMGSIPSEYTRFSPQNCQKCIVFTHEMPFTITAAATYANYFNNGAGVFRESAKANLNRHHNFEFQRMFKMWGIRLIFGGHKHTCSISYPIYDAPTSYIPYEIADRVENGQTLLATLAGKDTFNPIIQLVRGTDDCNTKISTALNSFSTYRGNIFNSTDTNVTIDGTTFNAKTTNSGVETALCRYEIVDSVDAPTYVMCQATGFKNLSNSDTSDGEEHCQWNRYLVQGSIIKLENGIYDSEKITPSDQLYPFYARYSVTENNIHVDMQRVAGLYDPSSKAGFWNINRDVPNGHEAKMTSGQVVRKHWAHVDIPLT